MACQLKGNIGALSADAAHVVAAVVVGGSAPEVGTGNLLNHLLAGIAVGSQTAGQIGEQNIEILTTDTDVVCTVRNGKRRALSGWASRASFVMRISAVALASASRHP